MAHGSLVTIYTTLHNTGRGGGLLCGLAVVLEWAIKEYSTVNTFTGTQRRYEESNSPVRPTMPEKTLRVLSVLEVQKK